MSLPKPIEGGWRERLRRWFRPPRTLRVTRIGRNYLILTFGVGLGALNTGNNLLYLVLGLLLSTIVISGILSERCLRHLKVRRVGTDGAFAGEPFAYRYAVSRQKGASFALVLSETEGLSGHEKVAVPGEAFVPYVEAGTEVVVRTDLVAPRRGPLRLTGLKVTTTFPLGLFAKSRVLELSDLVVVYPRRGFACADPPEREQGHIGDAGNPRRRDGTGELLGLRELVPGEDAHRVHWLKSAAAGKLLRVERAREERRQFVMALPSGAAGEQLDRRCEEVAAQAHRLLSQGHEVGLESGTTRLRPAAGPGQERRILSALAWAGFEELRG